MNDEDRFIWVVICVAAFAAAAAVGWFLLNWNGAA